MCTRRKIVKELDVEDTALNIIINTMQILTPFISVTASIMRRRNSQALQGRNMHNL